MPKDEKNRFLVYPFHLLMAWIFVELVHPIVWIGTRKWYHYILIVLWLLLLFVMDVVVRKLMKKPIKVWFLELVFIAMVVIFGILVLR